MKAYNLILACILIVACQNEISKLPIDSSNFEQSACDSIFVNDDLYQSSPEDPFTIEDVKVDGNCLKVNVAYGGGCGDVEFKMVTSGIVLYSYPAQLALKLSFKDADHCKALVHKTLSFDLNDVKSADKMIFHLKGWDKEIVHSY